MMGGPRQMPRDLPSAAPRPFEDRGDRRHAGFLMIAKGFIPEMGAKSFTIMKSRRECEVSGIPGVGVTIRSAGMKALHDGRCPVRGQSLIVASMARQRGQLTIPHLTPCPFPRVLVHDNELC
jgi:hypothetical protein